MNIQTGEISRFYCNSWNCERCSKRLARKLIKRIGQWAEKKKLQRLMTLTLNPKRVRKENWYYYIMEIWRKFRVYLSRKFGKVSFIWVYELQKSGLPHLHILISKYIPQKWLSLVWNRLGGGKIVDIRWVDIHRVKSYIAKYFGKDLYNIIIPPRKRRYGSSRDILLMFDVKYADYNYHSCFKFKFKFKFKLGECYLCPFRRKCGVKSVWILVKFPCMDFP